MARSGHGAETAQTSKVDPYWTFAAEVAHILDHTYIRDHRQSVWQAHLTIRRTPSHRLDRRRKLWRKFHHRAFLDRDDPNI